MPEAVLDKISVQVVYALPDAQYIIDLQLPHGSTAHDAVVQSGILDKFPELLNPAALQLGIYGKLITSQQTLKHGMRVEIYRALLIDPKESRRKRALYAKQLR